jgi:ketosteroid isomerase-like protein
MPRAADDGDLSNKQLMERVALAFQEGDLRPLTAILDENIVWRSTSPVGYFRFGGEHHGCDSVVELLAMIAATYLFRRFEPVEIMTESGVTWGLFRIEATHLPTGGTIISDYAARWRVRDGKLVEHQGFFDTAGFLIQQGLIAAPAPPPGGRAG